MPSSFTKALLRSLATLAALVFLCPLPAASSDNTTSILVSFTGDCTLGSEDRLVSRETSFVSHVERFGFAYPFEKVRDLFSRDDLTVINLESVLYDGKGNRADKRYLFRAPVSFAQILNEGSVELAFIANNHIMDYGQPGMLSTIQALKDRGVGVFGSNHAVSLGYIYQKDGIKIGFLGTYQAYWYIGREALAKVLASFEEAGCQVVVGVIHDGTEYATGRNKKQGQMAQWLVSNGVDLVIGHHPHVPQGIDRIGDATVLYSLGNFSFGGNKSLDIARRPGVRADKALIAQVAFRFDVDKNYLGHQVRLIPVSPSSVTEYNNYQPVILTGQAALDTLALVQADTAFPLPAFVEGEGALMDFVPVSPEVAEPSPTPLPGR